MNIVITGASRGIGKALVNEFINNYDNCNIIVISRNIDKAFFSEINNNSRVYAVPFDIEGLLNNNRLEFKNKVFEIFSSIDILINNAGYLINKPFSDITVLEAKKIFDVNFFASAELINLLKPLLLKSKKSHIVNIGSMGGVQGSVKFAGLSYYSASKAALAVLTESLAEEFKETNIRINCLALGAVQTEMLEEAFPEYKAPITANQMAKYITDFAVNGAKYYNGKILPVSLSTP